MQNQGRVAPRSNDAPSTRCRTPDAVAVEKSPRLSRAAVPLTLKEKKRLLVFAAAKFMGQKELMRLGVEFCQLPYDIHRIMGD